MQTKERTRLMQEREYYQATRLSPAATAARQAEWDARETAAIEALVGDPGEAVALETARASLRAAADANQTA